MGLELRKKVFNRITAADKNDARIIHVCASGGRGAEGRAYAGEPKSP